MHIQLSATLLLAIFAFVLQHQQQHFIRGATTDKPSRCIAGVCSFVWRVELKLMRISCKHKRLAEFPLSCTEFNGNIDSFDFLLNDNNLTQVPDRGLHAFAKHLLIKRLDLSRNQITHVHANAFKDVRGVERLYLNNNQLETIDAATFEPLRIATQHIDVSANNISAIENSTFANFSQLVHLDLSFNRIESIDPTAFLNCSQLQYLFLNGNNLKQIRTRLFFSLVNLNHVFLQSQRSSLLTIDDFAFERNTSSNHQLSRFNITLGVARSVSKAFIQLDIRAFCSRKFNNDNYSNTYNGPFAR